MSRCLSAATAERLCNTSITNLFLSNVKNLAKTMNAEKLSKRENVSDLISMRIILNDSLSTFNDVSKARTHVALLWASQANTLPATFWSLFYMIR